MEAAVALGIEHEGGVTVQRVGQRDAITGRLACLACKQIVRRAVERPHKRRLRAAQCPQQRDAVGIGAVGHGGELVAQALQLVGDGGALAAAERAVASIHHELAGFLHQADGVAHGGFRLGNRVALVFQRALLGLDAADAGQRAFGLGGRHGVVAGTHHTLARGQVLLQVDERRLPRRHVADGVVIHVGRANAKDRIAHVRLLRSASEAASSAQVLDQRVKDTLRNLQHLGRCLVGLLVLQQLGGFFVQVHARHRRAIVFQVHRNRL